VHFKSTLDLKGLRSIGVLGHAYGPIGAADKQDVIDALKKAAD